MFINPYKFSNNKADIEEKTDIEEHTETVKCSANPRATVSGCEIFFSLDSLYKVESFRIFIFVLETHKRTWIFKYMKYLAKLKDCPLLYIYNWKAVCLYVHF